MSEEVMAFIDPNAKPIRTDGRPDAVALRVSGALQLLREHKPEHVVIEVEITASTPTLPNGHKLVSADKILSAGTFYEK